MMAAISMLPLSRVYGVSSTGGSVKGTNASLSYIELQENQLASSVDFAKAISLATSSPAFQSITSAATYQFNSIYEEFSWSPFAATPSVVMNTVNVVYSHRSTDRNGTNVVAVEDSGLARIVKLTIQNGIGMRVCDYSWNCSCSGNCQFSGIWDGWEFSLGTQGVFESTAHWTVPQAHVPLNSVTGANCNWPTHCDFAPWVGLAENAGGSCAASQYGCIVQGGTDSGQQCGCCGCGPNNGGYYWPWYEFLPANPVVCGNTTDSNIRYGDSYSEDVKQVIGSTIYYITGNDLTTGYGCNGQANYTSFDNTRNCYYSPTPCANFAEVIGERQNTLPAFNRYTTSQCTVDPGPNPVGCHNIIANEYYMANCGYTNVGHLAPDTSDSWTTSYFGSSCT